MADIKDKLPKPPGEGDSKKGGVSHGVMSKSFGLQRKTLARVIGLETVSYTHLTLPTKA